MDEASKPEHALQLPAPALLSAAMAHEGLEVTLAIHRPARRGGGPLSVADRAAAVRTVGLYEGAGLLSRGDLAEGDDITYAFPDRVESGRVDEVLGLCDNVAIVARSAAPAAGWDVAVRQTDGCWHGVGSFPRSDDGYRDAETAAVQHAKKAQPQFGEVERVLSPGAARGFLLEIAALLRSSADDQAKETPCATLTKITELLGQAGVVGPFALFLPPREPARAGGGNLVRSEDVSTKLALRHLDRDEKELVETKEIVIAPSPRAESQATPAPALQASEETAAVETAAAAGALPPTSVGAPPPSSPSVSGEAPPGAVALDADSRPTPSETAGGPAVPTRAAASGPKKKEKPEPIAKEKPDAGSKDT